MEGVFSQYMGGHGVAPKKGLFSRIPVTFALKIDKNAVISIE